VCLWGAPADSTLPGDDYSAQLAASGGNTGNMFIGYGVYNNLSCAQKSFHPGFHKIPAENFHEFYDIVLIPASNFINSSTDLGAHFQYFPKTKASIVCFGLGSQFLPGQDMALQPGTYKFLRLISERSGSIGVRGAFTAEILWNLNLRNISVVGCPSLLLTNRGFRRQSCC
jgi:Polysaccharide pyruvyl transferase